MDRWQPVRASAHSDHFLTRLATLGISIQSADNVIDLVERALLGADLERLDEVYPADASGRRLVLTNAGFGVPALRVAFTLDLADEERVIFLDCGFR